MPSSTDDLRSLLNGDANGRRPPAGKARIAAGTTTNSRRPIDDRIGRGVEPPPRAAAGPSSAITVDRRRSRESEQIDLADISVTDIVDRTDAADPTDHRARTTVDHRETDDVPVAMAARPTSTLQKAWIDPEETPFEPVARPGNPLATRLISWIFVLAFMAGLGWLILPELDLRLASLETVELKEGVLSAQPVQLSPLRPAIVSELYVDASTLPDGVLRKGSAIALLEGTSEDGKRREASEVQVPFDARFVSVDTLVGGVVMPGTPVATIYDPSQMYVIVTVRPEMLEIIRRGMQARLISDVAGVDIAGEVISAVPLLGTDHEPTTANLVNIRIKPDPAGVADLVPGIRFDAVIDLMSAPADAQPLVFTYAGHVDADGTDAAGGGAIDQSAPGNG